MEIDLVKLILLELKRGNFLIIFVDIITWLVFYFLSDYL